MNDNSTPLVSILIPVWNVEQYIERCARSVFEQTYDNLEIIFVDDHSPDKSIQIIENILVEYPNRKEQVSITHHTKNRGICASRNTAIEASKGDFIFHVDSDDWLELNAIELLVDQQRKTNADIVTSNVYQHTKRGIQKYYIDSGIEMNRDDALIALLEGKISHSIWRRLIRHSLYKEHNIRCLEGANMDEDLQVIAPLFYFSKIISGIPDYIYHYNSKNDNSYCAKVRNNYELQDQLLKSRFYLIDFFKNKESIYKIALDYNNRRRFKTYLKFAIEDANKSRHKNLLKFIQNEKSFLPDNDWKSKIVKIIWSNYYLLKLYLKIR